MKYILVGIISILILPLAFSQNDWKLKKERKGIKVYTRAVEGSGFKQFKGITEVGAPLSSIIGVLMDIDSYTEWSPKTAEARVLEKEGDHRTIHYIKTNAPWPVSDRDGIYTMNVQKTGNKVKVDVGCKPTYLPEVEGVVRIQETAGGWELTPLQNGKVEVKYQVHSEPGGSIPSWLANSSVVDIPYETLTNLKEQVKKSKYQNLSFQFLR